MTLSSTQRLIKQQVAAGESQGRGEDVSVQEGICKSGLENTKQNKED